MGTPHFTVALSISQADLPTLPSSESELLEVFNRACGDKKRFLMTSSEGGALHWMLRRVCAQVPRYDNIYLLRPYQVLRGEEILRSRGELTGLLDLLHANPGLIMEATKTKLESTVELQMKGVEGVFDFELVQSGYKNARDGWLYWYVEDEVRALLCKSQASLNPGADYDTEGRSVEYFFSVLKSHAALLDLAHASNETFIFAQHQGAGWFPPVAPRADA